MSCELGVVLVGLTAWMSGGWGGLGLRVRGYALAVVELSVFRAFLAGVCAGPSMTLGLLPLRCLRPGLGIPWANPLDVPCPAGLPVDRVLLSSSLLGELPMRMAVRFSPVLPI